MKKLLFALSLATILLLNFNRIGKNKQIKNVNPKLFRDNGII
jgi:hypothetical protein